MPLPFPANGFLNKTYFSPNPRNCTLSDLQAKGFSAFPPLNMPQGGIRLVAGLVDRGHLPPDLGASGGAKKAHFP